MIDFKLAVRNLVGAGLRTWLNVLVLSLSYVIIIFVNGLLQGWNRQAKSDMVRWEIGQGQYWQENYDPLDPFTLQESHSRIPDEFIPLVAKGEMAPVLVTMASFYPEGRIQSILLKGIPANQQVVLLPTGLFDSGGDGIPAIIGSRMAESARVREGDMITVRWRDRNGTFDAAEIRVAGIFSTNVPMIDVGQIWIPLEQLQQMLDIPGEATLIIRGAGEPPATAATGWRFQNVKTLQAEIDSIIRSKSTGSSVLYVILLALALLAVFDTQVLSIFRRQREIGTMIALGMTRRQVVRLFTIEGSMHAVLAALLAGLYGIPLLWLQAKTGIAMPEGTDSFGIAVADKIYPVYGLGLVIGTVIFVLVAATAVSYLPARRISKLNPTEAIKGKLQ